MGPEQNKAVVLAHFEALNDGDFAGLDAIHDRAGRNHAPAAFDLSEWPREGKPFGPDQVRETFVWLRSAMPDLRVEVEEVLADGDQVVAWIRMISTRDGRVVDFQHAHRFRLNDRLIVEHWAVRDDLRAMILAGVISPPER